MNKSPWLTDKTLRVIRLLLASYSSAFCQPLIKFQEISISEQEQAHNLYLLKSPVLSHNNEDDPTLTYANASALKLWHRCWEEMIGMPSRLTAPVQERKQREISLQGLSKNNSIENYEGIRVNSKGECFMIKNAKIWTIWDEQGDVYGQAATFNHWRSLSKPCKTNY